MRRPGFRVKVAQGHSAEKWQDVMRTHIHLATKPILFLLLSAALALPLSPSPGPTVPWAAPGPTARPVPRADSSSSALLPPPGSLLHRTEPQSLTACLPTSPVNELLISARGRHQRSLLLSTPTFVKLWEIIVHRQGSINYKEDLISMRSGWACF